MPWYTSVYIRYIQTHTHTRAGRVSALHRRLFVVIVVFAVAAAAAVTVIVMFV